MPVVNYIPHTHIICELLILHTYHLLHVFLVLYTRRFLCRLLNVLKCYYYRFIWWLYKRLLKRLLMDIFQILERKVRRLSATNDIRLQFET